MKDAKKIVILAGEASGDHHGAQVVQALKKDHPHWKFTGMAGPKMREAGVHALIKTEKMAVMGFVEVLANIKTIYSAYRKIKRELKKNRPDLIVLIDYPGFNLKVAALAKRLGIKVLYYVSPQIWAWKKGRIKRIKRDVDQMAVIFPFEVKIYQRAHVPVEYVGSPIAETAKCDLTQKQACELLALDLSKKKIALLPGSRRIEIKRLLPVMLESAKAMDVVHGQHVQFILPVASTLNKGELEKIVKSYSLDIKLVKNQTLAAIRASDVALCTSGTVTLETALLSVPMVVIYKMHPLSFQIIKQLIKIKYISLCNIVAKRKVVPELIQERASVKNIVNQLCELLEDKAKREKQLDAFGMIKASLGNESASHNVARLVERLCQ